ncbi:MAG: cytochrome ubiquinol oxidase subunit I [Rhodospirillaceae bacterium]|nr:cytochrome ubiquinol oxidase subunit I [Rhodospirillaceae bacterium]
MGLGLDPLLLARLQFAFTISFHILFPAFTIGLAGWLVVLELVWLRTGRTVYAELGRLWTRVFAVSFGMGVVSGIVMSYEFGTNWSALSARAGGILGPLLSYEVLTAFFLEATFLGIMLFGWQRVGRGLHAFATGMVALGTVLSAFWIMAANSWMQTPAGYALRDGVFEPADWWAIVFNPSFVPRFVHMVLAAYLTTAFAVAGAGAWSLLGRRHREHARLTVAMALGLAALLAPAQVAVGDLTGLVVRDHQPAKLAALEGHWETGVMPLTLFGWPDMEAETTRYAVAVPRLGSLIVAHSMSAPVTGLKAFAPADRPNVPMVFWSFRVMVALGLLMVAAAWLGLVLAWRRRLERARWYLRGLVAMGPAGFIALLAGWFVAEVGRQPWLVQGLLRTAEGVSPVPGGSVAFSLALFVVVYGVIFGAGITYILRIIRRGPEPAAEPARGTPARPLSAAPQTLDPGAGR